MSPVRSQLGGVFALGGDSDQEILIRGKTSRSSVDMTSASAAVAAAGMTRLMASGSDEAKWDDGWSEESPPWVSLEIRDHSNLDARYLLGPFLEQRSDFAHHCWPCSPACLREAAREGGREPDPATIPRSSAACLLPITLHSFALSLSLSLTPTLSFTHSLIHSHFSLNHASHTHFALSISLTPPISIGFAGPQAILTTKCSFARTAIVWR